LARLRPNGRGEGKNSEGFFCESRKSLVPLAARAGGAVRRARWFLGGSVQPPRLLRALKSAIVTGTQVLMLGKFDLSDQAKPLAAAEFFSDFVFAQFSPDSTSAASVLMKVMHAKTSGTLKPEALSLTGP
jgi:hypothetical protein